MKEEEMRAINDAVDLKIGWHKIQTNHYDNEDIELQITMYMLKLISCLAVIGGLVSIGYLFGKG